MLWWLAHNTVTASILALAVMVMCRFWSFRPSIRHALWLVVLLKLIAPPLVAWPWNPLEALGIIKPEKPPERVEFAEIRVVNLVDAPMADGPLKSYLFADSKTQPADEEIPELGASSDHPDRLGILQPVLLSLWGAGAACMLCVQLIRASRFRKLMRGWRPAPRKLRKQVDRLAWQMKLHAPRLLLLPGLHSPFIWSLLRPWLLWPAALDQHLSSESHRTVIVHELAHLRRRDHWIGWLQLAGECIFWWNPLFWFVRRQIRFQAELACDAWVMHLLPEARRAYAEALIEVTALISRAPAPIPALGMSGAARQDFERRLTMIMSDKVPDKSPLLGLAAIGLLALAVLPAFSQDVLKQADPSKQELTVNVESLVKDSNEAKIDSLIVELDSLLSTINAAQDEGSNKGPAPAQANKDQQNVTNGDEVKLIEAIQLAYSDALLLKEGDDNQPEKTREEKIKQIEKNLQELLKEVQSLKAGGAARGTYRINVTPQLNSAQPLTLRATLAAPAKPGQAVKAIGQEKAASGQEQSGNFIYRLAAPKEGQAVVEGEQSMIFFLDGIPGIAAGDKNPIAPKQDEAKGMTIRVAPEAGHAKPRVTQVIAAPKVGQSKEMTVTVTKSKDGQYLNINGKVVPLPKAGESKTITIEVAPEAGPSKPMILHLNHGKDGQLLLEGNLNIQGQEKGQANFIISDEGEKQGAMEKGAQQKVIAIRATKEGQARIGATSKDAQPRVTKIIAQPAQEGGKTIAVWGVDGDLSLQPKDGKPFVIQMETPKANPQARTFTFSTESAPNAKQEPKKTEGKGQFKTEVFFDKSDTVFVPQNKQFQTWTVGGSKPKTQVLNRTTYKLPKDRAAAVAAFLKENVKGTVLETKVDGDSLTVTASPDVQKAVDSLLGLIQGKTTTGANDGQPQLRWEIKSAPDGKNSSSNGVRTWQGNKAIAAEG
ncbi:MAG TPA: M56 family metallopeptidase, partial [Gemmataceae bacterium]|nr:M56 family metallopeptidase [Gemmataceae bacterium]